MGHKKLFSKLSMATAGAAFLTIGTNLAPAQAVLLDFGFSTGIGNGSFTLDTSVPGIDLDGGGGLFVFTRKYINAVSGFSYFDEFQGKVTYNSLDLILNNRSRGCTRFCALFSTIPLNLPLYIDNLGSMLPSSPANYRLIPEFSSDRQVFSNTGGIVDARSLTVKERATSVPEPNATIGILAFGAIGAILSAIRTVEKARSFQSNT